MKLKSQPIQPSTATVDALRAQLDNIAAVLAIETDRDKAERAAAAEAARAQLETAQAAQRSAALDTVTVATKAVVDAIMQLDSGAMAELDKAMAELGACGGLPAPLTACIVQALRLELTATIARLGSIDPVLMGKPAKPSAQETALTEAARDLGKFTALFTAAKSASQIHVHGQKISGDDYFRVLRGYADGARLAARRLAALGATPPNLPNDMNNYFSLEVKP